MAKEKGYVYILTNPSFREDWVKIGKSSRSVEERIKELDTTAIPLPFEIYATLRTKKFDIAERHVHHMIDRLTTLRIRRNREFFNIKPDEALDIFKDVADLLDDAVIEIYHDGKVVETITREQPKEDLTDKVIFSVESSVRFSKASGYYDETTKKFTVLKGSVIAMEVTPTFDCFKARNEILKVCDKTSNGYCMKEDFTFSSVSAAASVVLGRSENGNIAWKNADGKKLIEVYPKK